MEDINRTASPMHVFEEDLSETRKATEIRKNELFRRQNTKSPFVVGSIEQVNRKIAKLDRKLQQYTELVCETRSTGTEDDDFLRLIPPSSAKGREIYEKKIRERKELDIFSGFYAIQQTLGNPPTDRVKNISKISMKQDKVVRKQPEKSSSDGQPKFVELHQYPGFDPSELTPLPYNLDAKLILEKVTLAQRDLRKKAQYRIEFEKLFYSQMSQAILPDLFWYYFLERFGSNTTAMQRLFNRIAHNFVKIMTYAKQPQYKEVFLASYPDLMSQAVYSAYCHAFPDSFKQLGEDFREKLVFLIWEWMAGIRPAPRTWMKWNFVKLEPPNIRMREEMMNNSKKDKKSNVLNLDFLDSLGDTTNQSIYSSSTSLTSHASHKKTSWLRSRSKRSNAGAKSISESESSTIIDSVATAQDSNIEVGGRSKESAPNIRQTRSTPVTISVMREGGSSSDTSMDQTPSPTKSKSKAIKAKHMLQRENQDVLSPIHEIHDEQEVRKVNEWDKGKKQTSQTTVHHKFTDSMTTMSPPGVHEKQSAPVNGSIEFAKCVFNVHGKSPLVAHFLRMKNLRQDMGTTLRVHRTEIDSLPPLDSQTYEELIRESFKNVKENVNNYKDVIEKSRKESIRFSRRQKQILEEYKAREIMLLANPKEVKRLATLLILEQNKDADSIPANANAAIETALLAQGRSHLDD